MRKRRGGALGLAATVFVLLLVLATNLSSAIAGITVEVTNCEEPDAPASECPTTTRRNGVSRGGGAPSPEVHQRSLENGNSEVRGGRGDNLTLDLSPKVAPPDPAHPHEIPSPKKLKKDAAADRGSVSTTGGSNFAGFGASLNFVSGDEALSRFAVPPFLLPIYVSAGRAYGVPWNVLASINQIETDFGRISNQVSSAGAQGWMQFMPGTWETYGVDASGDGVADPYNPVDAIYAAARYLKAAGGDKDIRRAIFAYNHAGWYVDRVMTTAGVYGSLPSGLVTEAGSLAFGHFPVRGKVLYGDDFRRAVAAGRKPEGLKVFPRGKKSTAVATQNVTVSKVLVDRRLSSVLDAAPRNRDGDRSGRSAGALAPLTALRPLVPVGELAVGLEPADVSSAAKLVNGLAGDGSVRNASGLPDGYDLSSEKGIGVDVVDQAGNHYRYEGLAKLADGVRPGAKLAGAKPIGRLQPDKRVAMLFSVRAAGGAPVDPRPLVDGYRLQEAADYYHAVAPLGGNPFLPQEDLNAGGVFGGSQQQLARKVLSDSGIQIYPCGREDITRGTIDRRILGALLYLRRAGMTLSITSLHCGHSFMTASGNVSAHSYGAAVDIAAFNGQPVTGHQGPGSLTEQAIKLLMRLDGAARPAQLISLMNLGGPSFALADHYDHLHVGYNFEAALGLGRSGNALGNVLFGGGGLPAVVKGKGKAAKAAKAEAKRQESRLSDKLGKIDNPEVKKGHSAASLQVEGEKPSDRKAAAEHLRKSLPFQTIPTSNGARTVAIDVPEGEHGDEAYAIGVVDGTAKGWKPQQTVLLSFRNGSWQIVGPPRDSHGKVTNPQLRALSTVSGGRGYAVGRRGTIVALRGSGSPRLLPAEGKATLTDIAVGGGGKDVSGYAVGGGGTVIRLVDEHSIREHGVPKDVDLEALTLDEGTPVAVGSEGAGQPAAYRRSGDWRELPLGFKFEAGTGGRLTSIAAAPGELWVGGAYGQAGGSGISQQLPFAARRAGSAWQTFCAADPALANVRELGKKSSGPCDHGLAGDATGNGTVVAVTPTRQGVLLATPSSLQILPPRHTSFRPLPVSLSTTSDVKATSPAGRGWLIGSDGRMARLIPKGSGASLLTSPSFGLPLGGKPGAVAVTPNGGRALAFGAASSAVYEAGRWQRGETTELPVRDAAAFGNGAVAIDETGVLLRQDGDQWVVPGADKVDRVSRAAFAAALGGHPLAAVDGHGSARGLQAVALSSAVEGYAVGARGLIEHYKLGNLSVEISPIATTLRDVIAGPGGIVAVGDRGTLLERRDGSWRRSAQADKLVSGQGFTALEQMDDGTVVAVAGGTAIQRGQTDDTWRRSELPPLGLPVRKLAAYREQGHLHGIALVGSGPGQTLLAGDAAGWRAIEIPDGFEVASFTRQPGSATIWVVGWRAGEAVLLKVNGRGKS
jgi:hypothetical protein